MKIFKRLLAGLAVVITAFGLCFIQAYADPLKSAHYEFDESALGGIGVSNANSANFQAQTSGGLLGVGTSASATLQVGAGHETTNDPALAFAINNAGVNFGSFSATTAATATASFQVLDYTSYGYIVQSYGTAPTSSTGHTISAMASTGTSTPGSEQFGMNLAANTSPITFGAIPDHGQFGFGSADPNYSTANNYRFVSGENIASAAQSSGLTTYTISYIVNVTDITPGGQYNSSQILICTGTY